MKIASHVHSVNRFFVYLIDGYAVHAF